MKNLSPLQHHNVAAGIVALGILVSSINFAVFVSEILYWIGLVIGLSGFVYHEIFARCPQCGKSLSSKFFPERCPRCGRRLDY